MSDKEEHKYTWGDLCSEDQDIIFHSMESGESLVGIAQYWDISYDSLRSGLRRKRAGRVVDDVTTMEDENNRQAVEIQALKNRITEINRQFKTSKQAQVGTAAVIDALGDSFTRFSDVTQVASVNLTKRGSPEEHILVLSDLHIGSHISETGGLSSYSWDIFLRRLRNLEHGILSIKEKLYSGIPVRRLNIFGLGDFIENIHIFEGQVWELDKHLVDQILDGAKELALLLRRLRGSYDEIVLYMVPGNHARTAQKRAATPLNMNFDYMFVRFMEEMLRDVSGIKIHYPEAKWMLVERMGSRFLLIHGEEIKSYLRLPYYGAERSAQGYHNMIQAHLDKEYGGPFDYMILGHFHNPAILTTASGEIIFNGSFPGGSNFSQEKMQANNTPAQWFLGINEKHGITGRWLMDLEDATNIPQVNIVRD